MSAPGSTERSAAPLFGTTAVDEVSMIGKAERSSSAYGIAERSARWGCRAEALTRIATREGSLAEGEATRANPLRQRTLALPSEHATKVVMWGEAPQRGLHSYPRLGVPTCKTA